MALKEQVGGFADKAFSGETTRRRVVVVISSNATLFGLSHKHSNTMVPRVGGQLAEIKRKKNHSGRNNITTTITDYIIVVNRVQQWGAAVPQVIRRWRHH